MGSGTSGPRRDRQTAEGLVLAALRYGPVSSPALRVRLSLSRVTVAYALRALQKSGKVERCEDGWQTPKKTAGA